MKLSTSLILALLMAFTAPLMVAGCGTTKPQTVEAQKFNTFKSVYYTARSAYIGHIGLVVQGKVSKAKELKVDKAWNDFRAGFTVAFQAASTNWEAATPEEVQLLATRLLALIKEL